MKLATKGLSINLEAIVEMEDPRSQDLLSPSSAASSEFDDNLALPPDDTVDIKSLMAQDCKEKEAEVENLQKEIATYYKSNMEECTVNLQNAERRLADGRQVAKANALLHSPDLITRLDQATQVKLDEYDRVYGNAIAKHEERYNKKMSKHDKEGVVLVRLQAEALVAFQTICQEPFQKQQVEKGDSPEQRIEKQVFNETQQELRKIHSVRVSIATKEVEDHKKKGLSLKDELSKQVKKLSTKLDEEKMKYKEKRAIKDAEQFDHMVPKDLKLAVKECKAAFDETKATVLSDLRQLKQQLMDAEAALEVSRNNLHGGGLDADNFVGEETTEVTQTEETEIGSTETTSEEMKEGQPVEEKSPADADANADADGNDNNGNNDENGDKNMKKKSKSSDDEDKGTAKRKPDDDDDDNYGGGAGGASSGGSKEGPGRGSESSASGTSHENTEKKDSASTSGGGGTKSCAGVTFLEKTSASDAEKSLLSGNLQAASSANFPAMSNDANVARLKLDDADVACLKSDGADAACLKSDGANATRLKSDDADVARLKSDNADVARLKSDGADAAAVCDAGVGLPTSNATKSDIASSKSMTEEPGSIADGGKSKSSFVDDAPVKSLVFETTTSLGGAKSESTLGGVATNGDNGSISVSDDDNPNTVENSEALIGGNAMSAKNGKAVVACNDCNKSVGSEKESLETPAKTVSDNGVADANGDDTFAENKLFDEKESFSRTTSPDSTPVGRCVKSMEISQTPAKTVGLDLHGVESSVKKSAAKSLTSLSPDSLFGNPSEGAFDFNVDTESSDEEEEEEAKPVKPTGASLKSPSSAAAIANNEDLDSEEEEDKATEKPMGASFKSPSPSDLSFTTTAADSGDEDEEEEETGLWNKAKGIAKRVVGIRMASRVDKVSMEEEEEVKQDDIGQLGDAGAEQGERLYWRYFSDGRFWVPVRELLENPDLIEDEFWRRETVSYCTNPPNTLDVAVFVPLKYKGLSVSTSASFLLPSTKIERAPSVAIAAAREYASSHPDFKGDYSEGDVTEMVGKHFKWYSLKNLRDSGRDDAKLVARTAEGPRVVLIPVEHVDKLSSAQPIHFRYNSNVQENLEHYALHYGQAFLDAFDCNTGKRKESPRLAQLKKKTRSELCLRMAFCFRFIDVFEMTLEDARKFIESRPRLLSGLQK